MPDRRMEDGGPGHLHHQNTGAIKSSTAGLSAVSPWRCSRHAEPFLDLGVRSAALSGASVVSEVGPRGRPGIGMPCSLHWACTVLLLTLMLQVNGTEHAPVCDCRCPAAARQAGGESSTSAACRVC